MRTLKLIEMKYKYSGTTCQNAHKLYIPVNVNGISNNAFHLIQF